MKGDGEHKLEELSRRFGVLDDEFARSTERADNCDKKVNIVTMNNTNTLFRCWTWRKS